MKVLQIPPQYDPCIGGIETVVKNIVHHSKHDNTVLCYNKCAKNDFRLRSGYVDGIKVIRVPYVGNSYKFALKAVRHLRGFDVIHVHGMGFFADLIGTLKSVHKAKIILSTHGGFHHTERRKVFKEVYFNWCRFVMRQYDIVTADSYNDYNIFKPICPKIRLFENPIDFDKFNIKKNVEDNKLIYIGRIAKNKRVDNLIRTLYHIKKEIPNIKLVVVGEDLEGLRTKHLDALVETLGLSENIEFKGILSDKDTLKELAKAKLFLCASAYEGFGLTAIETMSSGTPVVLQNNESFRHFVKDTVDFNNHEETAKIILNKLNKDLTNEGKEVKEFAKRFDIRTKIKELDKLYVT